MGETREESAPHEKAADIDPQASNGGNRPDTSESPSSGARPDNLEIADPETAEAEAFHSRGEFQSSTETEAETDTETGEDDERHQTIVEREEEVPVPDPTTESALPPPPALTLPEVVFGGGAIIAWLTLLLGGILVNTKHSRDIMADGPRRYKRDELTELEKQMQGLADEIELMEQRIGKVNVAKLSNPQKETPNPTPAENARSAGEGIATATPESSRPADANKTTKRGDTEASRNASNELKSSSLIAASKDKEKKGPLAEHPDDRVVIIATQTNVSRETQDEALKYLEAKHEKLSEDYEVLFKKHEESQKSVEASWGFYDLGRLMSAWFLALTCYMITNLAFLSVSAAVGGEFCRRTWSSESTQAVTRQLVTNYCDYVNVVASYTASGMRGFVVYLLVIGGAFLLTTDAIMPSQALLTADPDKIVNQYIRLAGVMSVIAFAVGYDSRIFRKGLTSAMNNFVPGSGAPR